VARKLPCNDVVLVVCLVGAERRRSGGTTARPSGGGDRAHRRCGLGFSGLRWCYWSIELQVGGGGGG
jgi:hypothetical protein